MKKESFLNKYWAYFFIAIPVALQAVFFYLPLVQGVYYSMTDWSGLTRNFNFVGLSNFTEIATDIRVLDSLRFTAIFTLALVVGSIGLGLFIAVLLNKNIKGTNFFRSTYFFPAIISTVTLGMIFRQIFNRGIPQVGELLGIEWMMNNILASRDTAVGGVIFVALWQALAVPIVIFLAGLQSVPLEIKEAADIDGANKWQKFKSIELPFLQAAISIVLILSIKGGLTAFDLIFTLTGGGPGNSTTPLGLLVYNYAFTQNRFGYANAIAIVTFVLIAVVSIIQIVGSRRYDA